MKLRIYLARRLGLSAITLLGVVVAVFFVTHILPGNPAVVMAGTWAEKETVERLERFMGIDRPLPEQFWNYFTALLHGNLGRSWTTGHLVQEDLIQRLPATVELASWSLFLAILIGPTLGVMAACRPGSWIDKLADAVIVFGASMPLFWMGLLLIFFFYYLFGIAPAPMGRLDVMIIQPPRVTGLLLVDSLLAGNLGAFQSAVSHLIWPVATLVSVITGPLTKMSKTSMSEILQSDYVLAARALGLSEREIVVQDALPNAMIPVLTMMGMTLAWLLAGNVIVEMIFAWPGIGSYAWNALMTNDFNAIQGFVLLIAGVYVGLNLLIDILYVVIDPRIRL